MTGLLDRFQRLLSENSAAAMFSFVDAKGQTSNTLSRGELDETARRIAALLREQGLVPGDRVMLAYSFSIDVVPAVLGCFFAGIIPCPVAPPNPLQLNKDLQRFEDLASDSGCKAVLTDSDYAKLRTIANVRWPRITRNTLWRNMPWLKTDGALPEPVRECHHAAPDDIAFLQYTSGSTSTPKGVMISFRNLEAQLDLTHERCPVDETSRLVAWIPYYHDHCLVAGILNIMFSGGVLHLMSPLTFLANPATWFDVLTRVRATGTAAPDFAFTYAVRKTTPEQRQQWDLSSIEVFQSGGEPIQGASIDGFFQAFAVAGLRADVFSPGYGMAEHVLAISNKVGPCKQVSIDRQQYEQASRVVLSTSPDSQILVGNGAPLDGVTIEIVDPESCRRLTPTDVGEIWIDSDSKALGYWNQPALNETEFNARIADDPTGRRFLRSGDLGFFHDGELFVAGRIKDTIVLRGRNIHPQDVEVVVATAHDAVRPGRAVAFSHSLSGESEHLAVVAELRQKKVKDTEAREIAETLRRQISASLSVSCRTVVFVAPDTLTKTTSGKHQRIKTRNDFRAGVLADRILWSDTLLEQEPQLLSTAKPEHLTEAIILERLVAEVAAIEASPVEQIDADASFSSFAIDSLAIMGLVLEMTTWTGREVSHEDFIEAGSLRQIAQTLLQADEQVAAAPSTATESEHVERTDRVHPLNPSQAWMFEPDGPVPHRWTVGGMVQTTEPVQTDHLQRALDLVVDQQEALRLRVEPTPQGWQQRIAATCDVQVETIDLFGLSGTSLRNAVERVVSERQQSMDLITGPAVDLVVMRVDDTEVGRILLLVHHLSVDAYSFKLVAADLMRTYEQLLHGHEVTLAKPSVSYSEWMDELVALAGSNEVAASADYFLNMPASPQLQQDNPDGHHTDGAFSAESFALSREQTDTLMKDIPTATGLSTATLLLTSLCNAVHDHVGATTHRFELVHHGRQGAVVGADLARTCAWMSVNSVMVLEVDPAASPTDQATDIQATIDTSPRNGLDYGLLAYMHPDPDFRERFRAATRPDMKFLWYGQTLGMIESLAERYPQALEPVGPSFDPHRSAHYRKYFYGTVVNGCIRLDIGSGTDCFHDSTRQALMTSWRDHIDTLIEHCS